MHSGRLEDLSHARFSLVSKRMRETPHLAGSRRGNTMATAIALDEVGGGLSTTLVVSFRAERVRFNPMSEATLMLSAVERGDPQAA